MRKGKSILCLLCAATLLAAGCGSSAAGETDQEALKSATMDVTESTENGAEPYGDSVTYNALDYVTLGDYLGLTVVVDGDFTVTDEEIEKEVELELSYLGSNYVETDKTTVEEGDTVNIDYVGKKDGVAFDGGTANGYNLTIGSGQFIPGFEDGLIGAKVGDVVDLPLTFPEDYHSEELAGADVVFTVTINSIVEPVAMTFDDLTDEYIQEKTGLESVDAYLSEVRTSMQEDKDAEKETAISRAVLEKLREVCTVSGHPEGLEEERIEQNIRYYEQLANANGVDLATMLESYNMTEESLREELKESVGDTVDYELILVAIADTEGISTDEDAYQAYIVELIAENGIESEDALYKEYTENYVRRQFKMDKARELVEDHAKITFAEAKEAGSESVTETEEE